MIFFDIWQVASVRKCNKPMPESLLPLIRERTAEALARLGTPAAVAEAYGLPEEAVRRVAKGKGLRGENYRAFVKALGLDQTEAEPAAVIARAAQQTRRNLVRLSEISGYAKRVLEEMRSVTASQERVVEQLAPYVLLEETVYGDPAEIGEMLDDVTTDAADRQARPSGARPRTRTRRSGA